jgi:hypothetical protein
MNRTALTFAVVPLLLASCSMDPLRQKGRPRYGYAGTDAQVNTQYQPQVAPQAPSGPAPIVVQDDTPPAPTEPKKEEGSATPPTPPAPVPEKKDYQYGTAVPGKPGFVTSPHAPYSGYVDVRGFPPGTEVKDPYTGKIFLVP